LNGFFVSDTDRPDGSFGTDVNEIELFGRLFAAAELNLGVARGGVAGGIGAEINFDLFDPNEDGKVRINEIVNNTPRATNTLPRKINEHRGIAPRRVSYLFVGLEYVAIVWTVLPAFVQLICTEGGCNAANDMDGTSHGSCFYPELSHPRGI
jgi:hypothetical protein